MEVMRAIKFLLRSGWHFLVSVQVPGMGFSFAVLLVGLFLARLGLRLLLMVMGVSFDSQDLAIAESHGLIERKVKKP